MTDENVQDGVVVEPGAVEGAMGADLAAVRELALRAYPETVPEMVGGESVAAILSSLEPAAAAYQRIVAGLGPSESNVAVAAPRVPAGGAAAVVVDPERLPSVEKIRRGLTTRRS